VLQGRFASVLKAENGERLLQAQRWLNEAESDLEKFIVLPFEALACAEFDRLRRQKKAIKMGRADLLIAAITLANKATLVTCNDKDFRKVPGLRTENWPF